MISITNMYFNYTTKSNIIQVDGRKKDDYRYMW